ncbi:Uncharacterised protein (plasmid) [Legionella adelaidensis]|uniref:DUF1189 domain-containing protein n=1 Tax=Legionella adelaidensis TaxID=45056 RepID=A0A0W0R4I0_9GAMM|nr:DUF1189 family protein [Legionella adelaidensis]KTC65988.1 hypothetical protein Lade_0646 [Legionella adelaidensis]VEH86312.1 Uncharacterised protein [Legionella adelaidensis]
MKRTKQLRPDNLPLYRYWHALYMSFYSPSLYVDVAKRWRGWGFLYLWLAIAVGTMPLSARIIFEFNQYFNQKILEPIKLLPPVYVQNGQVKFEKPMPYMIKNSKGEVVAIVDTTGAVDKITSEYPQLSLLITKNQIMYKPPKLEFLVNNTVPVEGDKVMVHDLNPHDNEVFQGTDWIKNNGVVRLKYITELLVYPLIVIFFLGVFWSLILLISILGQLIARTFFDLKLTFSQTCRVMSVAATPQMAFTFTTYTVNAVFGGLGLIMIALQSIYFGYAIIAIKRASMKIVHK